MKHKFLRAIGFSKYNKSDMIRPLLDQVRHSPTASVLVREGSEVFGHLSKSFGDRIGIRVYGEYEEGKEFRQEYFFPYADSNTISTTSPCVVERQSDRNAYGGLCEEPALGVSLIFYLSNGMEYARRLASSVESEKITGVSLTALSVAGKILLPMKKSHWQKASSQAAVKTRGRLIEAAKNGDEKAMESLAMEDMNLVQEISGRIGQEDLYSIVDTCFMPCGLECDQYAIIGEILEVETIRNTMTGENLYRMLLECNDVKMALLINQMDLLGEPEVGRRFKGDVWLQGRAEFASTEEE
ncbi:DUF3881 family protein [Hominifimenecus sp. rT4P-3]|uniref:DUF3881 family protein n=1 Tax=Hominifimenecus sp. rT4P-3 TaxID=3242979 RepID=UPI003DA49879